MIDLVKERHGVLFLGNFISNRVGTRSYGEDLAQRLAASGRRVIASSSKASRMSRVLDMVLTCLRCRDEYTVAHVDVFSWNAFAWAELLCAILRVLRKPHILSLRGGGLIRFTHRHPRRSKRLFEAASAVTSPSMYLYEGVVSFCGNHHLVPNAIDAEDYPFRVREEPKCKLVWLRAFHEMYNPMMIPEIMVILRERFSEAHILMIGPDKGDGSLELMMNSASKLGVEDHITVVGGVPKAEVPEELNQGDIFVNTTTVDNAPVSVIEAMACGLCVVSTDVDGIPYLLEHEQDALLCRSNDPKAMAIGIQRVLTEDGLAKRLSEGGRRKAMGSDWSTVLPQWELLIRSAENYGRLA